jgi:UDP-glucuronate 4-epimerase
MKALVTGAAGFIGSSLVDALLADGVEVRGVDIFTSYYDARQKQGNLAVARDHDGFSLVEADLRTSELGPLLDGVDVVFHQAAQPGVRSSWASGFEEYVQQNVLATQRLLEAAKLVDLDGFVYASSSSVYGQAARYPTVEADVPAPTSPYGVTKLAAEHLVSLYSRNFGLPGVSLRYFTVYGPRQRPDMALHRLIQAARLGRPFPLYGDGSHIRDFTFVADVVRANVLAGSHPVAPGSVFNVAGGGSTTMSDLIALVGEQVGTPVPLDVQPGQPGDVFQTGGNIAAIAAALGWQPQTSLADGVKAQIAWHESVG